MVSPGLDRASWLYRDDVTSIVIAHPTTARKTDHPTTSVLCCVYVTAVSNSLATRCRADYQQINVGAVALGESLRLSQQRCLIDPILNTGANYSDDGMFQQQQQFCRVFGAFFLHVLLPLSHKSGKLWACSCLRVHTFPILL